MIETIVFMRLLRKIQLHPGCLAGAWEKIHPEQVTPFLCFLRQILKWPLCCTVKCKIWI